MQPSLVLAVVDTSNTLFIVVLVLAAIALLLFILRGR